MQLLFQGSARFLEPGFAVGQAAPSARLSLAMFGMDTNQEASAASQFDLVRKGSGQKPDTHCASLFPGFSGPETLQGLAAKSFSRHRSSPRY